MFPPSFVALWGQSLIYMKVCCGRASLLATSGRSCDLALRRLSRQGSYWKPQLLAGPQIAGVCRVEVLGQWQRKGPKLTELSLMI